MKKKANHKLGLEKPQRILISDINIKSTGNKFDCFTAFAKNEEDTLMISETKFDSSFPHTQFCTA